MPTTKRLTLLACVDLPAQARPLRPTSVNMTKLSARGAPRLHLAGGTTRGTVSLVVLGRLNDR